MFSRRSKISLLAFLTLFMISMPAAALKFTGYIRNYMAPFISKGADYTLIKDTFDLDIEHAKEKIAFKADLFINHYPDQDLEIGMRQAYMNIYLGSLDIRIGKQQIIWGKAEGVFITDIVSPRDLREFLLPDFTEIRMGITALKANYALAANTSLEFVWIPVFTPTTMPETDSVWFPALSYPVTPTFDYSQKEVSSNLENSEAFIKFSMISSLIDFEIMAGYMWDDDPSTHVEKTIDVTNQTITSLTITPKHHRLGLVGGSFSTTIGGIVFRGEMAYYLGKYFSADLMTSDGTVEKDYLHYLGAVDFNVGNLKLSVQFIQQIIFDYDSRILKDEFENTMTFRMTTDFLRQTLKMEIFAYVGLNESDALLRFKISYDLTDGFNILLGTNLFFGDSGMFGQFDKNDMVYSQVKYSF